MVSVLITGSTSGIGESYLKLALGKGYVVFAGFRNEKAREHLAFIGADNLIPVKLDVTDAGDIEDAYKLIKSYVGENGLQGVVNNAGTALSGPLECLPMDAISKQFDINVFGVLRVIQMALPFLRKGNGRIINVGSISGEIAGPFLGPYSSSKFALRALSASLRMELKKWNIPVVLIEPGRVKTPIWKKSKEKSDALFNSIVNESKKEYFDIIEKANKQREVEAVRGAEPLEVAEVIEKVMIDKGPKFKYFVGKDAKRIYLLMKILPYRLIESILMKSFE